MPLSCPALKVHMSESAHDALKAFPGFITEPRGEIFVKVSSLVSQSTLTKYSVNILSHIHWKAQMLRN